MDRLLDSVYLDPESGAYLAGITAVYNAARVKNRKIKVSDVERYLEKQDVYTLHKETRRRFPRNRIIPHGLDSHWEIDLADLQSMKKENDGHTMMFVCRDVLSRYLWTAPLRNKKPETVVAAFAAIIAQGRVPWNVRADRGTEWRDIKRFCSDHGIAFHYATSDDVKCAVVERAIRQVKQRLWRHFTLKRTTRWLDILPLITAAINNSKVRTTKYKPRDVTRENAQLIRAHAYKLPLPPPIKFKYPVGTRVRIATNRGVFAKGYKARFSIEKFVIAKQLKYRRPETYRLTDTHGEPVDGVFYAAELVASPDDDDDDSDEL